MKDNVNSKSYHERSENPRGRINPEDIKPNWSDEAVDILDSIRLDKIKKHCQELRQKLNFKKLNEIKLEFSAYRVYSTSLERRLKSRKRRGLT